METLDRDCELSSSPRLSKRAVVVRALLTCVVLALTWASAGGAAAQQQALRKPPRLAGGPTPPPPPSHNHLGSISQGLSGTQGAIWPSDSIAVCWENPSAADQANRDKVRAQIAATWEANSLVRFTGWGTCGTKDKGIRIQLGDYWPHTEGVGTKIDGMHGGMKLNFTWSGCGSEKVGCVTWVATHEFGHALGFDHEQNRKDAPPWCREEKQATDPNIYMTPYDLMSVMNYCNPSWNNGGNLSADDIAGLQFWYGPSPMSGHRWLPDCRVNAVLYRDKNFTGNSLLISGTMDELSSADFNDRTSSLCVPAGFILKTFTDKGFKGKEEDFPGPTMLSALPTDNDKISSVQLVDALSGAVVFDAPPICATDIVVFQDSFFRKNALRVSASSKDLNKVRFNWKDGRALPASPQPQTVDDRISSICVPAGRSVTLYADKNFTGKSATYVGPAFRTNFNTTVLNDSATSIRVQ